VSEQQGDTRDFIQGQRIIAALVAKAPGNTVWKHTWHGSMSKSRVCASAQVSSRSARLP
jgi:hypothetical protein